MQLKRLQKVLLLAGSATVCLFGFIAGQENKKNNINSWFRQALELYKLDNPTASSDSTALVLFLKSAELGSVTAPEMAAEALIKAGNIHQGYQRYSSANDLYHMALFLQQKKKLKSALAYEAYLYLGSSHYFSNIIDSAQHYFEAASLLERQYKDKTSLPELDRLYNSLGAIYFESANYQQAKNYFVRALEFSSAETSTYQEYLSGVNSNIANCLMKMNRYDSALTILLSIRPDEQHKNIIRQNTAHCYFGLGMYDSALAIYHSLRLPDGFTKIVALNNMGRIYKMKKEWQLAESILDSAIAENKKYSSSIRNKEEALAYLYRGQLALEQGLPDEALTWYNEALKEIHLDFEWKSAEDLPDDITKTVSPITQFTILHAKAGLLLSKFNNSHDKKWLFASVAAYRKAIQTANFIKSNFDNDEAKLFFNINFKSIYGEALHAALQASQYDKSFADDYLFIIDHYKGNILYQNLQFAQLRASRSIPDSLLTKEKELKQMLAVYTTRINQITSEKEAAVVQSKILSLQVDLSRLYKLYDNNENYSYYKSRFAEYSLRIGDIQQKIDKNTIVLNYYEIDSLVYCFVISRNNYSLTVLQKANSFDQDLDTFRNEIYNYDEGKRYEGFSSSAKLYQQLIKPVEPQLAGFENWVIIPDGHLNYIPFEALIRDENSREYLVLSKTISYHYSFTLLFPHNSQQRVQPLSQQTALSFAPFAMDDSWVRKSNLPALPFSDDELNSLSGIKKMGKEATKKAFLETAGNHPLIHLATHASSGNDSSSSWIHFYPGDSSIGHKLYLPEIYTMDLPLTQLIVLSACETGGGTEAAGEGLLSLSRAFLYAGADGIISTLWKTEDRVTAFLMQRMHHYLQQGTPPEKALQLAKKDLMKDNTIGAQYKTPNYWANFIYSGKLHKMNSPQNHPLWWWGILTGTGLALLVLYKKGRLRFMSKGNPPQAKKI